MREILSKGAIAIRKKTALAAKAYALLFSRITSIAVASSTIVQLALVVALQESTSPVVWRALSAGKIGSRGKWAQAAQIADKALRSP